MPRFVLQAKGILGILNGVEDIVKPDNGDLGLEVLFNATSLEKKAEVKAALQAAQGFAVDPTIPLFIFMGRLDAQKGVDVLFQAVESVLDEGLRVQFVFMGSGIEELEEVASDLEARFPKSFKAVLSFKGQEKYKTYAASDFALMPSRYEPCGLVQMEGMRFGVLPIVAPTGGLADTVKDMKVCSRTTLLPVQSLFAIAWSKHSCSQTWPDACSVAESFSTLRKCIFRAILSHATSFFPH
jgi:granule-bound starch synthase